MAMAMYAQQPDFEPLFRQALEARVRALGDTAAKTRESARDLSLYLAGRGEYVRAAVYVEQALATSTSAEGAMVLHNWGVAIEPSDAMLAERLYRKALEIRVKRLPALDVELATTRLNLAGLLLARGEAEAATLAQTALVAFERNLGAMDARTGAACGMVGALLATKGDVAGSERMFRRALVIAEKAHGPLALETANALENLGDLLEQTGRELAARALLERAKKIRGGSR